MRPHQIFGAMSQEKCEQFMGEISKESPEAFHHSIASAAVALKYRPKYLLKQPAAKRVASVRRVLARPESDSLAEELLAIYFLRCRLGLLTEWLELMELAHEDGMLTEEEVSCPEAAELEKKVAKFRAIDEDDDRDLLLEAFSAQVAVDWPALDEILSAN